MDGLAIFDLILIALQFVSNVLRLFGIEFSLFGG